MKVAVSCSFCNGNGRVDEFECPCCLGQGTLEKPLCPERLTPEGDLRLEPPKHPNLFNKTPEYAIKKLRKLKSRRQRNTVALSILGLTDFKRSTDELEGAA